MKSGASGKDAAPSLALSMLTYDMSSYSVHVIMEIFTNCSCSAGQASCWLLASKFLLKRGSSQMGAGIGRWHCALLDSLLPFCKASLDSQLDRIRQNVQ